MNARPPVEYHIARVAEMLARDDAPRYTIADAQAERSVDASGERRGCPGRKRYRDAGEPPRMFGTRRRNSDCYYGR